MAQKKTPGVYVEEISTLPPSVAEVSTAVPAFIGYTKNGSLASDGPRVAQVNTLLEYESIFGKAKPTSFEVTTRVDAETKETVVDQIGFSSSSSTRPEFLMHYCLSMYFKNGGGSCYIVSVGNYEDTLAKADFVKGLKVLKKEDEPTLILLTDAVNLSTVDYHELCQQAMAQCDDLKDRFAILDVPGGEDGVKAFRNGIGMSGLMYAAAYLPYLNTSLNYQYKEDGIQIKMPEAGGAAAPSWQKSFDDNGIVVRYVGTGTETPKAKIVAGESGDSMEFSIDTNILTIRNVSSKNGTDVSTAWQTWKADTSNDPQGFDITVNGDGSGDVPHTNNANVDLESQAVGDTSITLEKIKSEQTALYNEIKTALTKQKVILPPSSAVAGVYAKVDRDRGVWKAPANVSLSAVIGPASKITHEEQASLNVDPTAGKSINAIRAFTGKGILIWGARTLAGNDNEWRYISVRRLFNMIEESTKKATSFAVFEPNDATTWLKVKGMIESYLYSLWERGALAGPTPETAYFVNVGLGKTMTTQDILEGRMIVEIGVAAVRPAEFIIIRFMHKLQEA
ncbi:phage tail sheath family protein [Planctomycetota bacterium]